MIQKKYKSIINKDYLEYIGIIDKKINMFVISPTDNDWFQFLKTSNFNSFINFWTPTLWNIQKLTVGERWYFLLKSPIRQLGGFGEFHEYKNLTALEAWKEFGCRNGCISKNQFISKIQLYIDKNSENFGGESININNYRIGCIILNNCQFWDEEKFQRPSNYNIEFPNQVVKFKYFNQYDPFTSFTDQTDDFNLINEPREQYRKETNRRRGQSEFKGKILKAYKNKCCITGENCPELLDAVHLQAYLSYASHHTQNGILLRVDLHRLFDSGLLFIDGNYIIHISSIIKNTWYQQFHNTKIYIPENVKFHPSKKALELKRNNFR